MGIKIPLDATQIMVKPVGSLCNLDCDYCYYKGAGVHVFDGQMSMMSLETFEKACKQYMDLSPNVPAIHWQGGEPTLRGVDFFRDAVDIEGRVLGKQFRIYERGIENHFQTNGTMLNDEWCGFFREKGFLVGLSVDGNSDMNRARVFREGREVYEGSIRSVGLLRKHGVDFNILSVVSKYNVSDSAGFFKFLLDNRIQYSQIISAKPKIGRSGFDEHSLGVEEYADFMKSLFDTWVEDDNPEIHINTIDDLLRVALGRTPMICESRPYCAGQVTIEWNGDVYPCDHNVTEDLRLGNVHDGCLADILRSDKYVSFLDRTAALDEECFNCSWMRICFGGCPRQRKDGEEKTYLCSGNKKIFEYVFTKMNEVFRGEGRFRDSRMRGFFVELKRDAERNPVE